MKIKTKDMVLVSLFTALMVAGAYVRIPFPYLPVTLQPFFCAFAGMLLGSRLGALSQLIYVVLGLAGLPVFSNGGGLSYIFQPSFGFLIGFILAAFVTGLISEGRKQQKISLANSFSAVFAGLFVIYAFGIPYMHLIIAYYLGKPDASPSLWYAVTTNLPYLVKDIVLFTIAALTADSISRVMKTRL